MIDRRGFVTRLLAGVGLGAVASRFAPPPPEIWVKPWKMLTGVYSPELVVGDYVIADFHRAKASTFTITCSSVMSGHRASHQWGIERGNWHDATHVLRSIDARRTDWGWAYTYAFVPAGPLPMPELAQGPRFQEVAVFDPARAIDGDLAAYNAMWTDALRDLA